MIDLRIYRASFLATAIAVVTVMFSIEPIPGALPEGVPPAGFDSGDARELAELIIESSPIRPGTRGDEQIGQLVEERFSSIQGGTISRQDFTGNYKGDEVALRNVILSLPGESPATLVLMAPRANARGTGAASSAAATGILLQLAEQLGSSRHEKTILLVSTPGTTDGRSSAREFVDAFGRPDLLEAAIVLTQPGSANPKAPFVLNYGTGGQVAGARLVETAQRTVTRETNRRADRDPFLAEIARLAFPYAVDEHAGLLDGGINAIGLSSAGERPLRPSRDELDDFSATTQAAFGRTALSILLALDATPRPVDETPPRGHVTIGDNQVPRWGFSILALALLLPPGLTLIDAGSRAWRRDRRFRSTLASAFGAGMLFLVPVVIALLVALIGIIPHPSPPVDPGRFLATWHGLLALGLMAAGLAAVAYALRPLTPPRTSAEAGAIAAGIVATLAIIGVWLFNPYLALLLSPAAHLWMLAATPGGLPLPRRTALLGLLTLGPATAAALEVASSLDLGLTAPWYALLAVVGGQTSILLTISTCFLAGSLVALVAATRTAGGSRNPEVSIRGPVSGRSAPDQS